MSTFKSEEDWMQHDEDMPKLNYELTTRKQSSAPGTVFISDARTPSIPVHLNDMFSDSPNPSSLTNLFVQSNMPKEKSSWGGGEMEVSTKDLFGSRHNTITKSRLSGIMATLDKQRKSPSDQMFAWPVGTKSSANSSTPTSSSLNLVKPDEYPHDIDFVEDSNEATPPIVEEKPKSDEISTPGLQYRMPKSAHLKSPFLQKQGEKDCSDSVIHQSLSNMQHPVSSLFAEDIKYSSIRNETSLLDLQHITTAPAAEEASPMRRPSKSKENGFVGKLLPHYSEGKNLPTQQSTSLENISDSEMVNLSKHRLDKLPSLALSLVQLDISNNNLKSLDGINNLRNLTNLRASGNLLTSMKSILNLPYLKYADLSDNAIASVDLASNSFLRLSLLNLSKNQIHSILNLENLPWLNVLYLDCNFLESISPKRCVPRLEVLYAGRNLLKEFVGSLFPNLKLLNLDYNRIEIISNVSYVNNLSLVSQNSSNRLSISNFAGTQISLSNNPQSFSLSESELDNVEIADFSGCSLNRIFSILKKAVRLSHLFLENNKISDISGIELLKDLQILHLSQNKLSDIVEVSKKLKKLPRLIELDLKNNQFISQDLQTSSQIEVAQIVMRSCILTGCRNLQLFNEEKITKLSRRKADNQMSALKNKAAPKMKSSYHGSVFSDWVPQLHPLQLDMTIGDDLVLEVLD